jgi:GNAT superfamily N-acetyltransferase
MITVRSAGPGDVPTLRRFEQGVIAAERPFDETLQPGAVRYYDLDAMVVDARVRFLVAESARTPVGCGFARLDPAKPYLRHAVQAYLGLMYVEPEFRGRGINRRVLDELKSWCRTQGVDELRLEVYSANLTAIAAYAGAGFGPHMLEMRLGAGAASQPRNDGITDERAAAELAALEPVLHTEASRPHAGRVDALLAPTFFEIGASGRRYSREDVVAVLDRRVAEGTFEPLQAGEFRCTRLDGGCFLVTYLLSEGERVTRRSSAWRHDAGRWQILYHQGTVVAQ